MFRTGLLAAVIAFGLGSSAALAAQASDADNNPVPGVFTFVNRPAAAFERGYAGPYRQPAPVTIPDRSFFDRHTEIN
jgi:hypothetical protein